MTLVLHPMLGRPGFARVWVGDWERTAPPELRWWVDGMPAEPRPVREVASARPPDMVDPAEPRAFTGVYEVEVESGAGVRVGVQNERGQWDQTWTWAPPREVGGGLNVLLVSCFHRHEEDPGATRSLARALRGLPVGQRPDLTILMGDQVYLDLPTLADFKNDLRWLARKFERDYKRNWGSGSGYHDLLKLAPFVCVPDDHEFWNNYPHASPIVGNTYTAAGRERWRRAAEALYRAFQLSGEDESLGQPVTFDVDPLSFCVLDTRSRRDPGRAFLLDPRARESFEAWCDGLPGARRVGVAVTGQLLTAKPAGGLGGRIADWELANYGDHRGILEDFGRVLDRGGSLVWLTGDVHWGRVTRAKRSGRFALHEIVASPATLVTTAGRDTRRRFTNWIGGIFGERDPWPRHSDAEEPPSVLALGRRKYATQIAKRQKGDHVALLRFTGRSPLEMSVSYWPVRSGAPAERVGPFPLRVDRS